MSIVGTDHPVRMSRWVHTYERDGALALYHSLEIDTLYLPKEYEPILHALATGTTREHATRLLDSELLEEVLESMEQRGFIVPLQHNDHALLREKRAEALPQLGLQSMYLLLTDNCNLRCSYCFVLDGMPECHRSTNMSWGVAKQGVDMFFANIARNPPVHMRAVKAIHFYGGEPLLRFHLLQRVVEYTEDTYAEQIAGMDSVGFLFSLVTNGTLITREIADFIAAHPRISVTVSIDGFEDVHDQARRTTKGEPSYEEVVRGLRFLKEAGCTKVSASCTVDEHNIYRLDDLLALHEEFNFLSVNLNPLLDTERKLVDGKYPAVVSEQMIRYFERARDVGVYEDRMMRRIRPFLSQRPQPYDCQATGSQIVCSPDGRLGVCHEGVGMKNFFFDDVAPDFSYHDDPTIQEWGSRTPFNMPQCHDCPAVSVCGGGCAYGAKLRNGSIWSVDDRFCTHVLSTLEWMIWDLYDSNS